MSSHGHHRHHRDMLNSVHAVCWPSLIWIVIKQVMHHSMSSSEQISSSNKHSSSSQLQSSSSKMSTQELTSSLSELKSNMTEMKSSLSSHLVAAAAAAAAQSSAAVAKFPSAGLLQGIFFFFSIHQWAAFEKTNSSRSRSRRIAGRIEHGEWRWFRIGHRRCGS